MEPLPRAAHSLPLRPARNNSTNPTQSELKCSLRSTAALSYVQTYASLRSLMVCNPIIGSLFSNLKEKRNFVKKLDKVVKRGNGLASIFEALNSDAVFTIANSLLYVGTSLGYALKPMVSKRLRVFEGCLKATMAVQNLLGPPSLVLGGFLGMILRSFFRMFNLIFFPSLLAFTSGLAVAGQNLLLAKIKLTCEGTYRYAERFSARLRGALGFISWMSFRDAITDLLLMVYNVAKTALQAQVWGKENISLDTLRAAVKESTSTESFASNVALKPRLSRDVHNITAGVTGLVMFFELRKLYRWTPRPVGETADSSSNQKKSERRLEGEVLKEGNEDISLINQRFEAFADLDIPPDWTQAAPELQVVDDSLLPAEKALLEKFASKRDYMMMSLLRRSVGKLISAFESIFGKLEKIVKLATHRDRVSPCSLEDRRVCMNAEEATKTRLTILHVMLAAHMGVFMGPGGGLAGSPEEIRQDFLNALRDAAWVRYRRRSIVPFKGKHRWGLDVLMDYLFPERKGKHDPDKPMTEEDMSALEEAVVSTQAAVVESVRNVVSLAAWTLFRVKVLNQLLQSVQCQPTDLSASFTLNCFRLSQFKLERLQCIDNAALFILTTDMGDSKVFRPVSPIPPEIKEQLCVYEHEFVGFNGWYQRTESEGHLTVPGIAEIKGYLTDAVPILRSKQEDEDVGHLLEAVLWSKGVQRIDARVASDLMVSTKRMLYPEKTWKEFFRVVSPVDLDYVQQRVSSGLQVESSKYTVKKPVSPDMKADQIVNALAMALESTLILAGSLRAGLQDLALITTGYLALEAIKLAERSVTGTTQLLKTFQERLWNEFFARKQCSPEKKISPHSLDRKEADREEAERQQRKLPQGASKVSISAAFALEEGDSELLFDDWCEEIYKVASNHPSEPGSANLDADDSGVIQCALLRFLGRRQVHLRKAKKTEKYSWRSYLNARPPKKGEEEEDSAAVRSTIRTSFASLKKAMIRFRGRLAHRVRNMAAKKLFKRRVFNILRGEEFLQILQLAALEAFADPSSFPESVLIRPSTLGAFARLQIILQFEVAPILKKHEGAEIVVQMKMMPASSPAMKLLIAKLETQIREAKQDLGDGFKKHVRRCAGYLSLLHISGASSGYIGPQLPSLFLRFAMLVDKESHEERARFLVTQRHLGFVEQASIKLVLKAKDALNLLEKSMKEAPAGPLLYSSLDMLSISPPLHLHPKPEVVVESAYVCGFVCTAANELFPKLGHPSLVLFCKLVLPARDSPLYTQMYEAGLMHLKELTEILETSSHPIFFQNNPNDSDSSLEFSSLEAVKAFVEDLSSSSTGEDEAAELAVGFMLHVPFMKALEVAGLSSESVGDGFRTSPLQCMPENTASGDSFTLPVNSRSRLRMLSSMLLHLEDAQNVVDSFQVFLPDATKTIWMDSIKQRMGEEAGNLFVQSVEPARPQDFLFDMGAIKSPEGSEDTGPGSFVTDSSFIDVQQPESPSPSSSESKGREELGGEQPAAKTPLDNTGIKPMEAEAVKDDGAEPDQANDVDAENWRNAKNTEAHLRQQLSLFEAHAFHFTAAFHTLLAAARLPSKVHSSVLRTFRDILSIATIGEPRRRRKSWRHRLARVVRRRRTKLRAQDAKEQVTFVEVKKPSEPDANSTNDAFYSWLLPASVERIGFRIRKGWKRLIAADFLSVRSAACEQEASLWRDTAPTPSQDESAAAGVVDAAVADQQQPADGAVAPEATPQPGDSVDSRIELCSFPLWLDLQARVTLEEQMLEEQQIFPYFVRMGIENIQLVRKAAQEALTRHLWKKLNSMKWLEAAASLEQLESIRDKLQRALLAVRRKHPLLEVESVRTLLVESTVDLLQQRDITMQRLQERIEGLQQTAVTQAAAHLISVTAGVERGEAERAVGSLMESASATSPESLSSSSPPQKDDGDASRGQHVLHSWIVQAFFFKDALLLLSRPAIFAPAAALLHALHVITSPKTRLRSKLKKTLKKMRQLSSTSLELLMRLPRAYIRLPQRHFKRKSFDPRISPVMLPPSEPEKQQIKAVIKKFPTRLPFKPRPLLA
ncbi:hypothetical protein Emag_006109 [Eimeria magna]